MKIYIGGSGLGLQCPACAIGYGDKTNTYGTEEHYQKYHNGFVPELKRDEKGSYWYWPNKINEKSINPTNKE